MNIGKLSFLNHNIKKSVYTLGMIASFLYGTLSAEAQSLDCSGKNPSSTQADSTMKNFKPHELSPETRKWIENQLKENRKPMYFHDFDFDPKPIVDPPSSGEIVGEKISIPKLPQDHKVQAFFRLTRENTLYDKPRSVDALSRTEIHTLQLEFETIYQQAKENGNLDSTLISGPQYQTSPVEYVEKTIESGSELYVYSLGGYPVFKVLLAPCQDGKQEIIGYILRNNEQPIRGEKE